MASLPTPSDLGPAGRAFWDETTAVFSFEIGEVRLLHTICRVLDIIAWLSAELDRGTRAERLTAARELRQQSLALSRLLGALGLPDEEGQPQRTAASRQAQRAVNARWNNVRRMRGGDAPA